MEELSANMRKSIAKYKPIEINGLTLYPIRVADYEKLLTAKRSLAFVTQALPIDLMSKPLLESFFEIDMREAMENGVSQGLLASALLSLSLALRLAPDEDEIEQIKKFSFISKPNQPERFGGVKFILDGKETVITSIQYAKLRQIIAAQNGVEIPSEDANPELLEAEQDLAMMNAPNLDINVESLVHAVCALSNVEEEEVYEWAILKLNDRLTTFKRIIDYVVCGIGESQGTTWKGGNPYPHPWFERVKNESNAMIPLDTYLNGEGMKAMQNSVGAIQDESDKT